MADTDCLRAFLGRLTDHHEAARPVPWAVSDAPADFIDAQLRALEAVAHAGQEQRVALQLTMRLGRSYRAADSVGAH